MNLEIFDNFKKSEKMSILLLTNKPSFHFLKNYIFGLFVSFII